MWGLGLLMQGHILLGIVETLIPVSWIRIALCAPKRLIRPSLQESEWGPKWVNLTLSRCCCRDSPVAQMVKNLPAMQETWVQSLGREDPLEKETATHSINLAWAISWIREAWQASVHGVKKSQTWLSNYHSLTPCIYGFPGGSVVKNLPSMQERPGFDPWFGKILWRRAWPPTPVFLLGGSHGQRSLVGYSP